MPLSLPLASLTGAVPLAAAGAAALLVTTNYWLSPFLFRLGHRMGSGRPRVEPLPADHVPAAPLGAPLVANRGALEALGFAATPLMHDAAREHAGYVQLFEHRQDGGVATLLVAPRPQGGEPVVLVGFATRLASGAEVRTGNGPIPSVFPARKGLLAARFPSERDAARLYALHRAHVARRGGRAATIRIGDPAVFQQREEEASTRSWLASGYVYQDGASLRPTWKGAFCMPYRLLFPWKQLNDWRDEALRRRLLPAAALTPR